ncbi:MAG: hypothetical protein ACXAC7_21720 [Candidatus Hodarchaeales archaeon]|jgi:hypothetical protein
MKKKVIISLLIINILIIIQFPLKSESSNSVDNNQLFVRITDISINVTNNNNPSYTEFEYEIEIDIWNPQVYSIDYYPVPDDCGILVDIIRFDVIDYPTSDFQANVPCVNGESPIVFYPGSNLITQISTITIDEPYLSHLPDGSYYFQPSGRNTTSIYLYDAYLHVSIGYYVTNYASYPLEWGQIFTEQRTFAPFPRESPFTTSTTHMEITSSSIVEYNFSPGAFSIIGILVFLSVIGLSFLVIFFVLLRNKNTSKYQPYDNYSTSKYNSNKLEPYTNGYKKPKLNKKIVEKCPNCFSEVYREDIFCSNCGIRVIS